MARIVEVRELPLDDLVIGKAQVRLRGLSAGIAELAESIRVVGLLEPICVAPADKEGKFEIITGQRRFLAHQELKAKTIRAAIFDEKVDEITAKVLSLTENLMRRDLNRADAIDACTALYKKYESIKTVAEVTGLDYGKVREYVKYDRLKPELRELVDTGDVKLKTALRAQDAASVTGTYVPEAAVQLAKEMAGMSGAQQDKLVRQRESSPEISVDDVIEAAKTGEKITQIVVSLGPEVHRSLQTYAKDEGTNQDDAAAELIRDSLSIKGYIGSN
jgi:ParB family transcriptional regulator, chromosome partitioning protein